MIINRSYFKNEIYLPEAKASITEDTADVDGSVIDFINEYSREGLIRCLGLPFVLELESNLDISKDSLIKDGADAKWDQLVNGVPSYIDSSDRTVNWRGLRYKSNPNGEYDKSFLAYYVFYFFEQNKDSVRGTTGYQVNDAKNAVSVSARPKVVNAWRKFVKHVQGDSFIERHYYRQDLGYGVDYMASSIETSLYSYVDDFPDVYPGIVKGEFMNINQFDL